MATLFTEAPTPPSPVRGVFISRQTGAGAAALLAILGLTTIWSSVVLLWFLWTTDALKSIGMVVPVVSFVLVLRAWRALGWEQDGSWWGMLVLFALALLVRIRDQSVMVLILSPQWSLYFPPHSLVMFAYGVGVVLLFGGKRLLRASLFPLVLLLFVNPIPHVFNVYVDLPLQRASAHIARAFAMALGQPLSPDKLRLMFTPEFGMFIAPGCNGIRGAVTMGLIALVAGYVYRFKWRAHALVVLGAVMLGYVFNFVRLCVLVLFYLVALHFPTLQDHAENADYVIGAVLFFFAVYLLYAVIQKLSTQRAAEPEAVPAAEGSNEPLSRGFYLRAIAFGLLVALGLSGIVHALRTPGPSAELAADEKALGDFPKAAGHYTLVRNWNETLLTGALLFHWAEYAPEGGGTHVAIGVSPVLGSHDTLVCHSARGEDPLWNGPETMVTAGGVKVPFSAAFFNDGATQFLEATTLCNGANCGEYSPPKGHFGFVYSKPQAQSLLQQSSQRAIPILVRAETVDTTLPVEQARHALDADVANFLSGVDLDALTKSYRRQ